MSICTAIIPVAGLGTRFLPITKALPKELLPIVDRPIIEHILEEAVLSGIENIIFITNHKKSSIEEYFYFGTNPSIENKEGLKKTRELAEKLNLTSVQQPKPLGLGHAVLCAAPLLKNKPFALLLGDEIIFGTPPCTRQLIQIHEQKEGAPVIGAVTIDPKEALRYGIIQGKEIKKDLIKVEALVEKPPPEKAPSCLAIPGRYILTPEIFSILKDAKPSINEEVQLTDALSALATMRPLYAYKFTGKRCDAGSKIGFLEANLHLALSRKDMRNPTLELLQKLRKEHSL